mgnify:CR=1 FL=1
MIHAEEVLRKTLQALRQQRELLQSPVHALVLGDWGVGKTTSAMKICKENSDTFYLRVPAEDITRSKLVKLVAYALRAGYRNTVEATLDLLKYTIEVKNLKPFLFVDEARYLFKRPTMLDVLKELAEDPDIGLSYIFLADKQTTKAIMHNPHSLHKRILITKELEPITEKTIKTIVEPLKLPVEPFAKIALARNWTTIDLCFVATVVAKGKMEPTEEAIAKVAQTLGR